MLVGEIWKMGEHRQKPEKSRLCPPQKPLRHQRYLNIHPQSWEITPLADWAVGTAIKLYLR